MGCFNDPAWTPTTYIQLAGAGSILTFNVHSYFLNLTKKLPKFDKIRNISVKLKNVLKLGFKPETCLMSIIRPSL